MGSLEFVEVCLGLKLAISSTKMASQRKRTRPSTSQNVEEDPAQYINVEKHDGCGGGLFPHKRGYRRFQQIMNARILPERGMDDQPDQDIPTQLFQRFRDTINNRGWGTLAQPPNEMNGAVVREFYANAYPANRTEFPKRSWVRGKFVRFDRHAINQYLGTHLFQQFEDEHRDEYATHFSAGEYTEEAISGDICYPGRTYDLNASGEPVRYSRSFLIPMAQVWLVFILSNIFPTEHTSDIVIDKSHLLWSLMLGNLEYDIGFALYRELSDQVVSERPNLLVLPGLITGLCLHQGVELPALKDLKLKRNISPYFIKRYCMIEPTQQPEHQEEEQPQPVPAPRGRVTQQQLHHQMQTMMEMMQMNHNEQMALINANHTQQQEVNRATYRAFSFFDDNARSMARWVDYRWPSHEYFTETIAWPGVEPIPSGGGAGAADDDMDDDEDDGDDAEA